MFMKVFLLSLCILLVVYIAFYLISYKKVMDSESATCYECGFDMISGTRNLFSYRFFLISILFLIFDVEIALMLSVPYFSGVIMGVGFFSFLLILVLGLLYEYNYGMLEWL